MYSSTTVLLSKPLSDYSAPALWFQKNTGNTFFGQTGRFSKAEAVSTFPTSFFKYPAWSQFIFEWLLFLICFLHCGSFKFLVFVCLFKWWSW